MKINNLFKNYKKTKISYLTTFKIGFPQYVAMIPGLPRSDATTIGVMSKKLSRTTASEFSFFLAVSTIFGSTALKSYDYYKSDFDLGSYQINLLTICNLVAFIIALLTINTFINYLGKHRFKVFDWYRITDGITILFIHYFIYPLTTIL